MSEPLMERACRGEPVERTPVWIMRQAGRYMPEYSRIREKHSPLDICHRPEMEAGAALMSVATFDFVLEAVRIIKAEFPTGRALIGFSGGPFTLASYLIEGGPSKSFVHTSA